MKEVKRGPEVDQYIQDHPEIISTIKRVIRAGARIFGNVDYTLEVVYDPEYLDPDGCLWLSFLISDKPVSEGFKKYDELVDWWVSNVDSSVSHVMNATIEYLPSE